MPRGERSVRRYLAQLAGASVITLAAASMAIAGRVADRVRSELTPPRQQVPASSMLRDVRKVRFTAADGVRLEGWYVPSRNGAVVVFGHGHGGQRAQLLPEARALTERGFGALLFDWRAHGESGGTRSTWGTDEQLDLDAAIGFVQAQPDVRRGAIGALGFSMGAMVVAQVAARDERLRGIVLEGSFTTLEEMIRFDERRFGWLSEEAAVRTLKSAGIDMNRVRPVDAICRTAPRPVLIVGGDADEAVPPSVARRLAAAACGPVAVSIIPRATHTSYAARGGRALETDIVSFFERALLEAGRDARRLPRALRAWRHRRHRAVARMRAPRGGYGAPVGAVARQPPCAAAVRDTARCHRSHSVERHRVSTSVETLSGGILYTKAFLATAVRSAPRTGTGVPSCMT